MKSYKTLFLFILMITIFVSIVKLLQYVQINTNKNRTIGDLKNNVHFISKSKKFKSISEIKFEDDESISVNDKILINTLEFDKDFQSNYYAIQYKKHGMIFVDSNKKIIILLNIDDKDFILKDILEHETYGIINLDIWKNKKKLLIGTSMNNISKWKYYVKAHKHYSWLCVYWFCDKDGNL